MAQAPKDKDYKSIPNLRVLELFSGIGGMHYALKYANLPATVVAAIDINVVANEVYAHNHKNTKIHNNNVQGLTIKFINESNVNMLVMSPPCQPHTRQGLQRDLADNRSNALTHICNLLPSCNGIEYILLENVKGFEKSFAREQYLKVLNDCDFYWREFILSPTQFGIPNSRSRYYCLARKGKDFDIANIENMPCENIPRSIEPANISIASILETEIPMLSNFLIDPNVLKKRLWVLDIVHSTSTNTMCFTKGYTHYTEGTGSVYTPLSKSKTHEICCQIKHFENGLVDHDQNVAINQERYQLLESLQLRYFTPREVARLMSFPEEFDFPSHTTNRQKYRLLGNSINVRVVGELMKYLVNV